jgi:SAM-dependent methyltransferase
LTGTRPGRSSASRRRCARPHWRNRAFLARAVRFLVRDAGIRQVIDIGTGIPAAGNVHEVAQQVAPDVRVAYVDNDPIVHVHADALLTGSGATAIVLADLREPGVILSHPQIRELIDFSQPAALLLVAILHFITDAEDPAAIVAALRDALAPGSYLALSHATGDFRPQAAVQAAAVYDTATSAITLRNHDAIEAFFGGFGLLDPGVVQMPLWRPDGRPPSDLSKILGYCGVGQKAAAPAPQAGPVPAPACPARQASGSAASVSDVSWPENS